MENTNKQVYRFVKSVPPNTKGIITEQLKHDATIEGVKVRIFLGAELDLKVRPFIIRENEVREEMITLLGDRNYINGDDDLWEYDVSIPVYRWNRIAIEYENVDTEYNFTMVVEVTVDYMAGARRVLSG